MTFEHLPPSPYDLAPPDETETYTEAVWEVVLWERPRSGGQRLEIERVRCQDEDSAAAIAERLLNADALDHEDYQYNVELLTVLVEVDPPEPDWDSAPGGHDDY